MGSSQESRYTRVWTFDFKEDVLVLTRRNHSVAAPLNLARERLLTMADFKSLSLPKLPSLDVQTFPGPYWDPKLPVKPRQKALLGRILPDFGHAWRPLLQRPQSKMTFSRLASAIVRIAKSDFDVVEHLKGPYGTFAARADSLPKWRSPKASIIPAGKGWFVLSQDAWEGLDMIRDHLKSEARQKDPEGPSTIYAIVTLRYIILCKADGDRLTWTKPEVLFDGKHSPSVRAIEMLLWTAYTEPAPNRLSCIPLEIQDRVLYYTLSLSTVVPAQMGCEFGWGTSYNWKDGALELERKGSRKRETQTEVGHVESQICFDGIWGGLTYTPKG
ncbi:Fc.00g103470.m01.CDS01 [Cosmosporella sp. VM-42]